jgi:thiol:disulfide interchange protein
LIVVAGSEGSKFGEPKADSEPVMGSSDLGQPSMYHKKSVTWSIDVEVPASAKPGAHRVAGIIGFQTCKDTACDMPHAAWFEGTLTVGDQKSEAPAKLVFWKAKYAEAANLSKGTAPPVGDRTGDTPGVAIPAFKLRELNSSTNRSFLFILASAFVGGFILNFMPCVLPVIGLKILTFVEQSGHDRRRIFMLNLWYSLGLLSVFMVLATLASAGSLGLLKSDLAWGEQFNDTKFNIVMSGLVFAMALSFMGIWEIPIPGFAGSGSAAKLATKEGAMGAFAKGALSTVLATPCSGPLLGAVFGYTLKQHWSVTFTIFGMIGLGMASPYLLIGAFPRLIRFLPKPGAWMDTFKHIMGFVLLGTVVFLFTFLQSEYIVPTFGMLVGIWAACWLIGRVSLSAEIGQKLRAWGVGIATAAVVGWISFALLAPGTQKLPWQPFTPETLAKYQAEGKTVMVDFTASWCLSCKTNLKLAINTDEVLEVIKKNDVVPLLADFSDVDEATDVKAMLEALNSNSIPVLALFPADKPGEALILRDLITQGQVIAALKEAGPSKAGVSVARAQ